MLYASETWPARKVRPQRPPEEGQQSTFLTSCQLVLFEAQARCAASCCYDACLLAPVQQRPLFSRIELSLISAQFAPECSHFCMIITDAKRNRLWWACTGANHQGCPARAPDTWCRSAGLALLGRRCGSLRLCRLEKVPGVAALPHPQRLWRPRYTVHVLL